MTSIPSDSFSQAIAARRAARGAADPLNRLRQHNAEAIAAGAEVVTEIPASHNRAAFNNHAEEIAATMAANEYAVLSTRTGGSLGRYLTRDGAERLAAACGNAKVVDMVTGQEMTPGS